MARASSALDIINGGLVMIGEPQISALTDARIAADFSEELYDDMIQELLEARAWNFARKMAEIEISATAPLAKYDSAYPMPADCIAVNAVLVVDQPIDFDIYGREIYCDATSSDTVILDYNRLPAISEWSAGFVMCAKLAIATIMAIAVKRDVGLHDRLAMKLQEKLAVSKTRQAQQKTTRRLNVQRFSNLRRSGLD